MELSMAKRFPSMLSSLSYQVNYPKAYLMYSLDGPSDRIEKGPKAFDPHRVTRSG